MRPSREQAMARGYSVTAPFGIAANKFQCLFVVIHRQMRHDRIAVVVIVENIERFGIFTFP